MKRTSTATFPIFYLMFVFFMEAQCAIENKYEPKAFQTGIVKSLNYPNAYPRDSDEDYVWRIKAPGGYIIKIEISSVNLNNGDELLFYDGWYCQHWAGTNEEIRRYKGIGGTDEFFSPGKQICVELERNKGVAKENGFMFTYTVIPKCGGDLTGPTGDIVSQYYPTWEYGSKQKCEWKINVEAKQHIKLTFRAFELEADDGCDNDFVQITSPIQQAQKFCGKTNPGTIVVQSSTTTILFKSDRELPWGKWYKGFWLQFEAVGCKEPKSPDPTVMNPLSNPQTFYNRGYVAKYKCKDGFHVSSTLNEIAITCKEDNTWEYPASQSCKAITCGDPVSPRNSKQVSFQTDSGNGRYSLGIIATYSCLLGYDLKGNRKRTCVQEGFYGRWSGSVPICNGTGISSCGDPGDPLNGQKIGTNYSIGASTEFSCDIGYRLQGPSKRQCQLDGTWNGIEANCSIVTCNIDALKSPGNGNMTISDTFYESIALYTCNTGYLLVGNRTSICQATGKWNGEDPQCEAIVCGKPMFYDNSNVSTPDGLDYGKKAIYSCKPGYRLDGIKERQCDGLGQWTGNAPICSEIRCPQLNDTNIRVNGTLPGDNGKLTCPDGHHIPVTGMVTIPIECLPNGTWSGQFENCVPMPATAVKTSITLPSSTIKSTLSIKPITTGSTSIAPGPDEYQRQTKESSEPNSALFIGIGVGAGVLVLIGILCGFLLFRRKRSPKKNGNGNMNRNFENPMYGNLNQDGVGIDGQNGTAAYRVPHVEVENGDIYAQSFKQSTKPTIPPRACDNTFDKPVYAHDVMNERVPNDLTVLFQNDLYESSS